MAQLLCGINKICKVESKNGYCLNDKNSERLAKLSSSKKYTNDEQDIIYSTKLLTKQVDYLQNTVKSVEKAFDLLNNSKCDEQIVFSRLLKEAIHIGLKINSTLTVRSSKKIKSQKNIDNLLNLQHKLNAIIKHIDAKILFDNFTKQTTGTRSLIEISSKMIHQQGNAVENFGGTCGLCSIANATTMLGDKLTEKKLVNIAKKHGLCTSNHILAKKNGGTNYVEREMLIQLIGYNCESKQNQNIIDIFEKLNNGKQAIISVDSHVLQTHIGWVQEQPEATNHVVTIVDVETNSDGIVVGLWIHDTGICSDMGNLFFCNVEDYELWKNTPTCYVQYISK